MNFDNKKTDRNEQNSTEIKQQGENTFFKTIKKMLSRKRILYVVLGVAAVIITLIVVLSVAAAVKKTEQGGHPIQISPAFGTKVDVTKISVKIENIIKQSNLSVLSFPFEGSVEWIHGDDNVGFINYAGSASLGIDFSQIKVDAQDEDGNITIHVPAVRVTSYSTEKSKFKYIYTSKEMKKTYGTQSYESEAYKLCNENMLEHVNNNTFAKETAQKYVSDLIHGLTDPILEAENLKCIIEIGD